MTLITKWVQQLWFFYFAKYVFFAYAKLFLGLKVYNVHKVPPEGGLVVVCNHFSALDPPVTGVSIPRETHFMAKKELFEGRYLRALVLGLRAFPVDRIGSAAGGVKGALRRLEKGLVVGIFIQGTRNAGDAKALDGAAFIAQRAGVPLQPTAIWRDGRAFRVKFGDIIVPEGKSREETAALTESLMHRINEMLPEDKKMPSATRVAPPKAKLETL